MNDSWNEKAEQNLRRRPKDLFLPYLCSKIKTRVRGCFPLVLARSFERSFLFFDLRATIALKIAFDGHAADGWTQEDAPSRLRSDLR